MEDTKEVRVENGCSHTCIDLHKFCPKNCCLAKCLLAALVLFGVFVAGFMAGSEEGEGRHGYGREGRGGYMMMRDYQGWDESDGWDYPADGMGNMRVIYRTVDQSPSATVTPR